MSRVVNGIEPRTGPVEPAAVLSEAAIWSRHGPTIWQTRRFEGIPHFYPVYRYEDLYSYSLFALILHKGSLQVNPSVAREVETRTYPYQSGNQTIDREIERLGGPVASSRRIRSPEEFARRVADGMRADAAKIEQLNPGCTNVLMCGGLDSLNMLLLPWRHPVVVASAPPNYDLVRAFLLENGLSFDLVRLDDADRSLLEAEVLANACRNDLEHCRWGPDLVRLARDLGGRAVFWKGQLGAQFLTPKWKEYWHEKDRLGELTDRVSRLALGWGRYRLRRWVERSGMLQRRRLDAGWRRGAMWQGAHCSMLRQLTDALVVSIYHGPAMRAVREETDLRLAVPRDVRPLIGEYLYGTPPIYPSTNPGPEPSDIRRGMSGVAPFVEAAKRLGLRVISA
jgi:hypothetical protein